MFSLTTFDLALNDFLSYFSGNLIHELLDNIKNHVVIGVKELVESVDITAFGISVSFNLFLLGSLLFCLSRSLWFLRLFLDYFWLRNLRGFLLLLLELRCHSRCLLLPLLNFMLFCLRACSVLCGCFAHFKLLLRSLFNINKMH